MIVEKENKRWIRSVPTKDLRREFKTDVDVMKEIRRRERKNRKRSK